MFVNKRDEMSILYRGPSKDTSYQISVLLGKRSHWRRFFRNQPISNKNCLWWPCLLADRYEMSIINRRPSIDASYQVSVHLAKWVQRRRFLEIGQSEKRIACGGHVCKWIGTKCVMCIEDLPYMLPTKLRFNWLSSF